MAATQRATERPSVVLIRAGSAFNLLEAEGVDTLNFLQRVIDDPRFRQAVANLTLPTFTALPLPRATRDPEAITRLMRVVFAKQAGGDFSPHEQHFVADCLLPDGLRDHLKGLDSRSVTYLVLAYGLDGKKVTRAEIRIHLGGVTNAVLDRIEREAKAVIYMNYLRWAIITYNLYMITLDDLRFSRDTMYCLDNGFIRSLGDLVGMTFAHIRGTITRNMDVLNEVSGLVHELGLKFADET